MRGARCQGEKLSASKTEITKSSRLPSVSEVFLGRAVVRAITHGRAGALHARYQSGTSRLTESRGLVTRSSQEHREASTTQHHASRLISLGTFCQISKHVRRRGVHRWVQELRATHGGAFLRPAFQRHYRVERLREVQYPGFHLLRTRDHELEPGKGYRRDGRHTSPTSSRQNTFPSLQTFRFFCQILTSYLTPISTLYPNRSAPRRFKSSCTSKAKRGSRKRPYQSCSITATEHGRQSGMSTASK